MPSINLFSEGVPVSEITTQPKKGLIVKKIWLDKILDGGKVWEMRWVNESYSDLNPDEKISPPFQQRLDEVKKFYL